RELYAPNEKLKELELPVIQWEDWNKNSKEAKFIIKLGLQTHPSFQTIMNLMVQNRSSGLALEYFFRNRSSGLGVKALEYFVSKLNDKYSREYNSNSIQEEFLPCVNSGIYAKPSECYSSPDCAVMGFKILHQRWHPWAVQLGVKQHPDHNLLIERLKNCPPRNIDDAKRIFEYLAKRR
ncbi:28996_t:CDS:2, partial [Racocetra persica]